MNDAEKIESLSVIIPAFNEELIIERSILLLCEKLKSFAKNYEVIIVDDGSSDRTPDILKKLVLEINELKFIRNDVNQGLGFSLRKGFLIASQELIFYTDADLPIDYNAIYEATKILEETNSDFVAAFRFDRSLEPMYRNIYSFVYNWLIRSLFGVKIKDVNFSCKLIKKDVLEKLHLKADGSFIDAEMMIKAYYYGYKIEQFGCNYFPRKTGSSHLAAPQVILKILYEMIKYWREITKEIRGNVKSLVITADDFGLHPDINRGIELGIREGIIKSVSFVTNTALFEDSLKTLRQYPDISVGVHLNLTDGEPLSSANLEFLTDREGRFLKNHLRIAYAIVTHPVHLQQIKIEFELQIKRLIDSNINISHLNSHGHIHIIPGLFKIVLELAEEFHIPFIRIPNEKLYFRDCFFRWDILGVNVLSKYIICNFGESKFKHVNHFSGLRFAGKLTKERLIKIVSKLNYGVTEITVHPGYNNQALSEAFKWRYSWDKELYALIDERIKEEIKSGNISLVNFQQIS